MERKFDKETLALMREKYPNSATTELLDELEMFYDKLESGSLMEFPCKVGDTFYGFPNKIDSPDSYFRYMVKAIKWKNDGLYLVTIYDMEFKYGVEAFLTESEARLKKVKGK